jgi:hypothetical protein
LSLRTAASITEVVKLLLENDIEFSSRKIPEKESLRILYKNVSMRTIMRDLAKLKGMNLLIPLPKDQDLKPDRLATGTRAGTDQNSKPVETTYTIKKGDTLWSIADQMGVNIGALTRWNNLHPEKKLMPGDKLIIRMNKASDTLDQLQDKGVVEEIIYVVKEGDIVEGIAVPHDR